MLLMILLFLPFFPDPQMTVKIKIMNTMDGKIGQLLYFYTYCKDLFVKGMYNLEEYISISENLIVSN